MKNLTLLTFITLISLNFCKGQDNQHYSDCLYGKWKIVNPYYEDDLLHFRIYKNEEFLNLIYKNNELTFTIFKYGFINTDESYLDSLNINSLNRIGKKYLEIYDDDINIQGKRFYYEVNLLYCFVCDSKNGVFSLGNSKIFDGEKIVEFPKNVTNSLPKDIKSKFIAPDIKKIKSAKAIIYKSPNIVSNEYLIKGNKVEVLLNTGIWLKIRRIGKKTTEGWIKKVDIK